MITINARNVNDALLQAAFYLRVYGQEDKSRNGPVLRFQTPATITYQQPTERVILHPFRDANPFFHLYESLWMLAGRNDLEPLTQYVKRMAEFSDDDGKTQPGAYGHRWRKHFDRDQLAWAINRLRADKHDRRVVIQMYDANTDQKAADSGGRDIPCNLMALPSVNQGALHLTVFNRSNDMVWGAVGSNPVHFSILQEYLARALGLEVGQYYQISNNLHAYKDTFPKAGDGSEDRDYNPYPDKVKATQIFPKKLDTQQFDEDLEMFMENPARTGIRNTFLRKVACPMIMAHKEYKKNGVDAALEIIQSQLPEDSDWRAGAEVWLENRRK